MARVSDLHAWGYMATVPDETMPDGGRVHERLSYAPADRLRAELLELFSAHDKAGAVATALAAVRDGGISIPDLYVDVLGPALVEMGAGWQNGRVAVWEEHLASTAVRTIVECLYPDVVTLAAAARASGRTALLACPPEEAHDLGLRMLADRLALAGWRVHYLGADTPPDEIAAAARTLAADAVMLSSSTHYHRLRLRDVVGRLEVALPGVSVWVGGPAFGVPADDWTVAHLCPDEEIFSATEGTRTVGKAAPKAGGTAC